MSVAEDYMAIYSRAIERTLEDSGWFYKNILRFPALDWQVRATDAVLDVRKPKHLRRTNKQGLSHVTIRSCHGTGKTQWLGLAAHAWNFVTYGTVAATAPKEDQILRRLFPRYRRAMRDADDSYKRRINVLGKSVQIGGDPDWGILAETASDPDNLAGYHDNPQFFIVDEASAKRLDPMFPVIEGALTTPGSVSVEIGNPTRMNGEFYDHHCKRGVREMYYRMHLTREDAPHLVTQKWLDGLISRYGKDSPIVKVRGLGEFASLDDSVLIPLDMIDEAFDTVFDPDGSLPIKRISVDVSDGGGDDTVYTVGEHYDSFMQVLKQKGGNNYEPGKATMKIVKDSIALFEAFECDKQKDEFVVDANGVGAGVASRLDELGYIVIRHMGGENSDKPGKWRNRRVQNHIAMYEYYRDGRIGFLPQAVDDEEELRAQLLMIKRRDDDYRRYEDDIEDKKKVKQENMASPDRVDSLSMQFTNAMPMGSGASLASQLEGVQMFGTLETAGDDGSFAF